MARIPRNKLNIEIPSGPFDKNVLAQKMKETVSFKTMSRDVAYVLFIESYPEVAEYMESFPDKMEDVFSKSQLAYLESMFPFIQEIAQEIRFRII